jgi:predicted SprT family Zn-dependent metalloprotease
MRMNGLTAFEERAYLLMEEGLAEMKAVGLRPAGKILSIRENRRAKKRLGCCRKISTSGASGFELEISTLLREKEDRVIKEILLHELLHTCRGCLNHGAKWKAGAELMNQTYGYHITTTANYDALQLEEPEKQPYRYIICCQHCGNIGYRMRKSKVIKTPKNYRCAKCGGPLKVEER